MEFEREDKYSKSSSWDLCYRVDWDFIGTHLQANKAPGFWCKVHFPQLFVILKNVLAQQQPEYESIVAYFTLLELFFIRLPISRLFYNQ